MVLTISNLVYRSGLHQVEIKVLDDRRSRTRRLEMCALCSADDPDIAVWPDVGTS